MAIQYINVTRQQHDKGQRYLNGEVKDTDMYILAHTYWNEICSLVGYSRLKNDTDRSVFTEFCQAMICGDVIKSAEIK